MVLQRAQCVWFLFRFLCLLGGAASTAVPHTSYKCVGETDLERICTFKNLVMHRNQFYYITEDADSVQLPKIAMTFKADAPNLRWDFKVETVNPTSLPFSISKAERIGDAIIYIRADSADNLYHMVGEHSASMHALLCKHLDYCKFGKKKHATDLQIIFGDDKVRPWEKEPNAKTVAMIWDCFSSRPPLEQYDPELKDRVFLIDTALTGIGNECRAFLWCSAPELGRKPLPLPMMQSWRTRLTQCLNTNQAAIAQVKSARITIIQRSRSVRRSIVNILDVVRAIKAELNVDASVKYLDGLELEQQAKIYSQSDIIIAMHGAAAGNLVFLPKNAVFIEIMPLNWFGRHEFEQAYVNELQPVSNIKLLGCDVTNGEDSYLRLDHVKADPVFRELLPEERSNLLENGQCPPPDSPNHGHCTLEWFLHDSDAAIDVDRLIGVIHEAMDHIKHWRGRKGTAHHRRLGELELDPALKNIASDPHQQMLPAPSHAH